jgi:4'-phosphopantetheinyl transferase EntD
VIEEILPATVASAEAFTDSPEPMLFPQEAAIVARASDKRRREFTAGRECARIALGKLGVAPAPILIGERGAPQWPPGIVGSITHCDGYRAAAVAHATGVAAIGLDAEPGDPLPRGVLDVISLPAERARLTALTGERPTVCWDRLLFSAKESVYKAWFPLTGRWLGFEDADVTIRTDGTFAARLLTEGQPPPASFAGRWLADAGLILTAITVPAPSALGELPHPDLARPRMPRAGEQPGDVHASACHAGTHGRGRGGAGARRGTADVPSSRPPQRGPGAGDLRRNLDTRARRRSTRRPAA